MGWGECSGLLEGATTIQEPIANNHSKSHCVRFFLGAVWRHQATQANDQPNPGTTQSSQNRLNRFNWTKSSVETGKLPLSSWHFRNILCLCISKKSVILQNITSLRPFSLTNIVLEVFNFGYKWDRNISNLNTNVVFLRTALFCSTILFWWSGNQGCSSGSSGTPPQKHDI